MLKVTSVLTAVVFSLLGLPAADLHWREAEIRPHPGAATAPAADPGSFDDLEGFHRRRDLIAKGLGTEDLARWRRGWFKGGDPGKYLPLAAMARLVLNPADEMALAYMNDERSPKELYHFAGLNWARFLPLYGDVLNETTMATLEEHSWRHAPFYEGKGTENHRVMWRTAGLVLPHHLPSGRGVGKRSLERGTNDLKNWLKRYVRGLYQAGMGEWESATYHMFCMHGMLNVYDFTPDPEARLWAAAALDYYAAAVALKYTDGVLSGPSQRGYSPGPAKKITDQTLWLWWGANAAIDSERAQKFRYAMQPATSSWRPNKVLSNIARRKAIGYPASSRGSKPNYWLGMELKPKGNRWQESLWVTPHTTLGSLWKGWDPHGQTVRWQLTAAGKPEAITLNGGHPWGNRTREGLGRYEQTMQVDSTLVLVARIPDQKDLLATATKAFEHALANGQVIRTLEPDPEAGDHPKMTLTTVTIKDEERKAWIAKHVAEEQANCPEQVYLEVPPGMSEPVFSDGWWTASLNDTYIALRPLGGKAEVGTMLIHPKVAKRHAKRGTTPEAKPALVVEGRQVGFVLHVGDRSTHPSIAEFTAAVKALPFDDSGFSETLSLTTGTLGGKSLGFQFDQGAGRAAASIDGEAVSYENWLVFAGPHVTLADSVLSISDGREGYIVDVTGEAPVYRPLNP